MNITQISIIVSVGTICLAYFDMPYGYYTFLRIIVCFNMALVATVIGSKNKLFFTSAIIGAILYNPLIKIHLTRDIWQVINAITLIVFFIALSNEKIRQDNSDQSE